MQEVNSGRAVFEFGEWFGPATISALASVASAVLAIYIFRRSSKLEKRSHDRELMMRWSEMASHRRALWERLEHGYETWYQEGHFRDKPESDRPPAGLLELIELGGCPNALEASSSAEELLNSISKTQNRGQQWLLQFAQRVMHSKYGTGSIVLRGSTNHIPQWKEFDEARSALYHTIYGWLLTEDSESFKESFVDYRSLIIMLIWLEIGLGFHLGRFWSSRGQVVRLAAAVERW